MEFIDVTWSKFKEEVAEQFIQSKKFIYRGQSNSHWFLKTKIHRTGLVQSPDDIELYFDQVIPIAHESVAAWEGRIRNLTDPFELAQFLAYLQHNTFPTPLLDWTYSPYIAAYFAFDGIDHFNPDYDNVCIYCFDKEAWLTTYKQSYDYRDKNIHVSILEPSFIGNPKQLLQLTSTRSLYVYKSKRY